MNMNKKIIQCIQEYCKKRKDIYKDCINDCIYVDEKGKCKYYDIIDYIINEDVF